MKNKKKTKKTSPDTYPSVRSSREHHLCSQRKQDRHPLLPASRTGKRSQGVFLRCRSKGATCYRRTFTSHAQPCIVIIQLRLHTFDLQQPVLDSWRRSRCEVPQRYEFVQPHSGQRLGPPNSCGSFNVDRTPMNHVTRNLYLAASPIDALVEQLAT